MEFPLSSGARGLGRMQTSTQAIIDRVVRTTIRVKSGSCELTGGHLRLGIQGEEGYWRQFPVSLG